MKFHETRFVKRYNLAILSRAPRLMARVIVLSALLDIITDATAIRQTKISLALAKLQLAVLNAIVIVENDK